MSFVKKYKYWIVGGLILLLILWNVFGKSKKEPAPTYDDTVAVEQGDISDELQVLGSTKLETSQTLTFGIGGRVTRVHVKQGEAVKKGQVLAEIDSKDIENDIKQQELVLQSSQINYDKLLTNTKDYQITQAENTAQQTILQTDVDKLTLQNLQLELDNKIKEQESTIAEQERRLALLQQQGTGSSIDNYNIQAEELNNIVLDALQQMRSTVSTITDMFKIDYPQDNKRVYLGSKIPGSYDDTKAALDTLSSSITDLQKTYDKFLSINPKTPEAIQTLQQVAKTAVNSLMTTTKAASVAVTNSVSDTRYYSENEISADSSSINGMNSKALSLSSNLNNVIKVLQSNTTDIMTIQNNIDSAKRAIEQLKTSYALQIQQKENDIALSSGKILYNNQNVDSLKNGPTEVEKLSAENQIAQASLGITKAKIRLENYRIIALFDGVVSSVPIKVGDQVTAQKDGITVESPGVYEVDVLLDQLDVVKVQQGQNVYIDFDAYPNRTLTGTINEIDPTPTVSQGVVSYTAKIILQMDDMNIYNQMSATVRIVINEKKNVILIPTIAITSSGDQKTVQVWNDGKIEIRNIVVGITNGQKTEIISGLSAGERVLTKTFAINEKKNPFGGDPEQEQKMRSDFEKTTPGAPSTPSSSAGG